jgi:outer membrane protein assembly factor BamB
MNRVLKVALLGGLAVTVASCRTVRGMLPFGLGGKKEHPGATATDRQRFGAGVRTAAGPVGRAVGP